MKRYCNENDPRSVIFVSNYDNRRGTTFNFAHPPKWRWLGAIIPALMIIACVFAGCKGSRLFVLSFAIARVLFYAMLGMLLWVFVVKQRKEAERQLSLYPGPMGPRAPDGLDEAPDLFQMIERRDVFLVLWMALVVVFAVFMGRNVFAYGYLWRRSALGAAFGTVMVAASLMLVFGCCGLLFRNLRYLLKKTDAYLIPFWGVLLVMLGLMYKPVMDFCSSRTVCVTLPSGEQAAFRVAVNDDRERHFGDGWKAYRGYRDGKAYLLIESGTGGTSVIHVGTKGPISFFSTPMKGDDITVFNMHSKRVFHVKRGDDGVWSMKGDNSAWVQ